MKFFYKVKLNLIIIMNKIHLYGSKYKASSKNIFFKIII